MYNSGRFLGELFDRLTLLSSPPAEIVLLDDASRDNCHRLAMDFAAQASFDARVIRNEMNTGIAAAYNQLAASARYDWVHILDADDYPVEHNYYDFVGSHMASDAAAIVTAVKSNSRIITFGNQLLSTMVPRHPPQWWPLLGSFATRSGVIYRRKYMIENPFPDPAYPGSDVIQLLTMRTARHVVFEPRAHIYYRVHRNASSSQARTYSEFKSALKSFPLTTCTTHRAELAIRRVGQILERH